MLPVDKSRTLFYIVGMGIRRKFRKKREALGLTPYAMSVGIGMDPSYWKHFEEGRCTPRIPTAKKIAEFLTSKGQPTEWQEVVDQSLDEEEAERVA